jgi:hypothetical protein
MGLVEVSSQMSAGDLLVSAGTLLLAVFTALLDGAGRFPNRPSEFQALLARSA